jgi:phosphatidylserine/phosphatidylglycerophosphate/cardiolipin synthase-like enzyme
VVHHKFIVIDAEGANPVVYTGSANMSRNSEQYNDENLLEIRDARIAAIYLAEFLRLYEHYRARALSIDTKRRGGARSGGLHWRPTRAGRRSTSWREARNRRRGSRWRRSRRRTDALRRESAAGHSAARGAALVAGGKCVRLRARGARGTWLADAFARCQAAT